MFFTKIFSKFTKTSSFMIIKDKKMLPGYIRPGAFFENSYRYFVKISFIAVSLPLSFNLTK